MNQAQGWVIIGLLMSLLVVGFAIVFQLEDLQTTVQLSDLACF